MTSIIWGFDFFPVEGEGVGGVATRNGDVEFAVSDWQPPSPSSLKEKKIE